MPSTCECGRTISANKKFCRECGEKPTGCLEILNVQGGDVKITFDKSNDAESIRARRIIQDMLRRGFALVAEVERDGERKYERVREFDAERGEYIIADFDSLEAAKVDSAEPIPPEGIPTLHSVEGMCKCGRPAYHRGSCKGARSTRRLPMETTKATGIGMSAGG